MSTKLVRTIRLQVIERFGLENGITIVCQECGKLLFSLENVGTFERGALIGFAATSHRHVKNEEQVGHA